MIMNTRNLVCLLSQALSARANCDKAGAFSMRDDWDKRIDTMAKLLPSGSGIDNGTTIDVQASSDTKLVLGCSYHHMNDAGMYDGWTEHTITIRPTFTGLDITVSGRNRNDIKEYLACTYEQALTATHLYGKSIEAHIWPEHVKA